MKYNTNLKIYNTNFHWNACEITLLLSSAVCILCSLVSKKKIYWKCFRFLVTTAEKREYEDRNWDCKSHCATSSHPGPQVLFVSFQIRIFSLDMCDKIIYVTLWYCLMVPQETFLWWKQSYHEHVVLDSYYDYLTSKRQSWICIH